MRDVRLCCKQCGCGSPLVPLATIAGAEMHAQSLVRKRSTDEAFVSNWLLAG